MTEAEAFIIQARSDFKVFEQLWEANANGKDTPECHALQHLQLATEKLAKSVLLYLDSDSDNNKRSHVAFRKVAEVLKRGDVARKLGYGDRPDQFRNFIVRRKTWFVEVEQLCPSVGTDTASGSSSGPNVEYPWLSRDEDGNATWIAPAEQVFPFANMLRARRSPDGAEFIKLVRTMLERVPDFFGSQ